MSRIIENPKELILAKAKEILYKSGYQELSMRNVSKCCNIALGTIYNYYPTKKELVIEMMTDYWCDYIRKTQSIVDSEDSFYDKLRKIFDDLNIFIQTFKEVWLKPELYNYPNYVKDGAERENIYIEKLILLVRDILVKDKKINRSLDSYETANFIVMNLITIIQMPAFKYSSFEVVLKVLLD